jgi:C1A family cysteine protease
MSNHGGRPLMRRRSALYGLVALAALSISGGSLAQSAPQWHVGPINPAFQQDQQESLNLFGVPSPNYGFRPAPLALPTMTAADLAFNLSPADTLPSSYDLRTLGKLSPVGNQGQCGCCWAFATMGSLESNLLPDVVASFSENNLKDTNGFDYGWNGGGNRDMATAYFARWSGPVDSSADPFNPNSGVSPANLPPSKHVQEVLYLPDRSNATDNNAIKQAIMTYGAVFTNFYMDQSALFLSGSSTTYYNPGGSAPNHAVDMVGWDDNFDKSRFKTPAPGNGAFICRNSWGTSFGEGGYFYVSYYDKWTGRGGGNTVFDDAEATTNYKQIYQYDPLGCVESIGFGSAKQLWFSNVFTAKTPDNVAAVSFYTLAPNTSYTVYVYNNATSGPITAGTAHTTDSGSFSAPGYHTVALSNPITLTANQKFSVVVEVSANSNYLAPVQARVPGYTSQATAATGRSYVSADGKTWSDLTAMQPNMSVCLKAFTVQGPPVVATPTFSPAGGRYNLAQNVTIACATDGATIHYTTNGNDPTESDPTPDSPVAVGQTMTLKAKAWVPGDTPSAVATATYTIAPYATSLTLNAPTGAYGQAVNLKAVLACVSPAGPLNGRTLTFQLVNSKGAATVVGTGTTNANGVATCSYTIADNLPVGANTFQAIYAGETGYKAVTGSSTLTVTKAGVTLAASSATGKAGAQVNLTATLTRATDGEALANKTISFSVNGAAAVTATTNSSGVATLAYTIPAKAAVGNLSYSVAYAGDGKTNSGSATGTITVTK